jgi:hypothetical protein
MSCPNCQFDHWKSALLIHSEGNLSTSSSSIGSVGGLPGASPGDGQEINIGAAHTMGQSQTKLSSLAAPPEPEARKEDMLNIFVFLILVIAFCIGWKSDDLVTGIIYAFFVYFPVVGASLLIYPEKKRRADREENSKRHSAALSEYQRKVMCIRCGTFYLRDDLNRSGPQ